MVYHETVSRFTNKWLSQFHNILKKHLKLNAQWIPRSGAQYSNIFIYEGLAHFAILGDLKFEFQHLFIYFIIILIIILIIIIIIIIIIILVGWVRKFNHY